MSFTATMLPSAAGPGTDYHDCKRCGRRRKIDGRTTRELCRDCKSLPQSKPTDPQLVAKMLRLAGY